MKYTRFIVLLAVTALWIFALNTSWGPLPPVGKLLSPFTGFWQNEDPKRPNFKQDIDLDALANPVQVVYDDRMVPHIYAQNMVDAAYVQGFVTARDRLWQMDFITRAAGGRLSEILGKGPNDGILNYDREARRMGMVYAAENAVSAWSKDPRVKAIIDAYTAGVNAWIDQLPAKRYPIEFKILNYRPEHWTPLKTALLNKYMARDLANWDKDLENTNAMKKFGRDTFNYLFPETFAEQSPVIPDSAWNFQPIPVWTPSDTTIKDGYHYGLSQPEKEDGLGSNNWAVAGWKTASGAPILCNDPHLALKLPSVWYEIHLCTPEGNVYGVSLPGAPGVIIGFNDYIAWGVTNVSHDVKDWYKIQWKDSTRSEYLLDSAWKKPTLRKEIIQIKGGQMVEETIRYTDFGPVVSEDKSNAWHDLALHWLPNEPSSDAATFLMLDQAKNYEDYLNALRNYTSPAQNFVFADRHGNIALWANGKYPLRYKGQGRFIQDGTKSSEYWQGFIPFEHNPHQFNPSRGFCSSANQNSTGPSYPYYYLGSFEKYRGRYINERLEGMSGVTTKDLMNLQNDPFSIKARTFVPLMVNLLAQSNLSQVERKYLDQIRAWDYRFTKDNTAGTFFNAWFTATKLKTYDEMEADYPMPVPEDFQYWKMMGESPDNAFFDIQKTPEKEGAMDVVTKAFKETVVEFENWSKENNGAEATWDKHEHHAVRHLLPTLAAFHVDLVAAGDKSTPNALGTRKEGAFYNTTGPSWRMVVEMGQNKINAFGVFPGGPSGNPGSPWYDNMIPAWSNGEYYEINFWQTPEAAGDKKFVSQSFY